jgi:hypothetical protein
MLPRATRNSAVPQLKTPQFSQNTVTINNKKFICSVEYHHS